MNPIILIFSKDRALQLDATISSLFLHCRDVRKADVVVLAKSSSEHHREQYNKLELIYPSVRFIWEENFRDQVIALVNSVPYILFLVDDNIFVRDFFLEDAIKALEKNPKALGFSLRLGKNTNYCYSLNRSQTVPAMAEAALSRTQKIVKFNWPSAEHDFNYPLEVSSSIYRVFNISAVLSELPFNNPNHLEGHLAGQAPRYGQVLPELLCYEESVTFCNPINKVQKNAPDNRAGNQLHYSADELANIFDRGGRIEVSKFTNFTPNACHQEVELPILSPIGHAQRPNKDVTKTPLQVTETRDPTVAVIIPCFKQAHLLPDAVESLVAQTFDNWECIIVNDGSPDDTTAVANSLIQRYRGRKISLFCKDNEGLAEARNSGISLTKAPWILPLDSDDKFAPTFIERALKVSESDPTINIVSANLQEFGARSNILEVFPFNPEQIKSGNMFPYASMYRRSLWEKYGGYIPIIPFGAEDWNFWVTCSRDLRQGRIAEPLFLYRKHQNSSMVDAVISHQLEVDACLHTIHPDKYDPAWLIRDHEVLSMMAQDTVQAIGKIIFKFPKFSQPYLWRGLFHEHQGLKRQARRDFLMAIQLDQKDDWQAHFRLVLNYAEAGEKDNAAAAARKVLELRPEFPAREALLKII
jgi:glycosyltransferase involved in cell wall biosynthesis